MKKELLMVLPLALGLLFMPGTASGQGLEAYDYENLDFRGFSLEGGYLWPSRVDPAYSVGVRVDMGYLGPGLRIVPGISYWSSSLKGEEVAELEGKVDQLILDQVTPGPGWSGTDLGVVDWSDLALTLDAHLVWSVPFGFLSFAGIGFSAHIMNGEGDAIAGTFVEDLLDTVSPGFNFHGGLEYPFSDLFRLYAQARYEFLEDLRYPELRMGGQIMVGPSMPDESRAP